MTPRRPLRRAALALALLPLAAPATTSAAPPLAPATPRPAALAPPLARAARSLSPATPRPAALAPPLARAAPPLAPPVGAAPPATDDERKAAARRAVDAAAAAFTAGDFAGALARFEEAMALRPNPKLHYNLGVCHQRLTREAATRGDPEAEARHASAAIDAFNAYLRGNPDATDRVAVENLVRDLGGTPATQPALRDPLAPLPTAPPGPRGPGPVATPLPNATPGPVAAPLPDTPAHPAGPPASPPVPTPPLPRGYVGAATGLVTQPQLLGASGLDGGYQAVLLARGGARLGKRRGLELGGQAWLAFPGQTAATNLALSTQALLLDVGHAFSLGPARRLELPLGAEFGVAREGLRVRTGQPLPACAAHTAGTLVSARVGGVAGGRIGFAVLVGPRRNHEIGMQIHLAFFGFGPGPAATSCDERPFAAAGIARARLVLSTSLGYAFRF